MSKIEVNTVAPQCGTTLTLGESGDTVTLGTGASQSGFGRTGTVDWQTGSIKTSTFTAANGEGYFANTSGGAFTMNLPAGSAGNIVSVVDYTNTFQTHNLTVSPNGSEKIGGVAGDVTLSTEGQSVTLVYVDANEGWKNVQDSTSDVKGNEYIIATGGTITTSGNDKIHTFTGPGTFTVGTAALCAANNLVSYMVVAGGGGGSVSCGGGGGGAGGYRETKSPVTPYTASPLDGYGTPGNRITVTATGYPITVGGGGPGGAAGTYYPSTPDAVKGTKGSDSIFSTITSTGGGEGAAPLGPSYNCAGFPGGSGGGGGHSNGSGGTGNTPSVTPAQGNTGNTSIPGPVGPNPAAPSDASGGGGGAGAAAVTSGACTMKGNSGVTTNISSAPVAYAGGGGGTNRCAGPACTVSGGTGGGGRGGYGPRPMPADQGGGVAGTVNTGGGGGGATGLSPAFPTRPYGGGGQGGSGIVIIRYKYQ